MNLERWSARLNRLGRTRAPAPRRRPGGGGDQALALSHKEGRSSLNCGVAWPGFPGTSNTGYTGAMAKVMVSLPDELLDAVDAEAARRGTTRSGLLRATTPFAGAAPSELLGSRS